MTVSRLLFLNPRHRSSPVIAFLLRTAGVGGHGLINDGGCSGGGSTLAQRCRLGGNVHTVAAAAPSDDLGVATCRLI